MRFRTALFLAIGLFLAFPAFGQKTGQALSHPNEKLSFAPYYYWYQGDSHKSIPTGHVKDSSGASLMVSTPLEGVGPWMTSLRSDWHKNQLTDIRKAGVDVVLPVFWSDTESKKNWSIQGLDCMVQALKEMRKEDKEIPQVALYLDTRSLTKQLGKQADLSQPEVQGVLYGMIRDFYLHVPSEFRAHITEDSGATADIVMLGPSSEFTNCDPEFVNFCNKRFQSEFGEKLTWIGDVGFKKTVPNLDGYFSFDKSNGADLNSDGRISTGVVRPGYDNSLDSGEKAQISPRLFGDTYKKNWDSLLAKTPDWVIVESWNNWAEGTQIAPDRTSGYQMVDLTRIYLMQFNGMKELDAKFMQHDIPAVMMPNSVYQVNLQIRNSGKNPWTSADGVSVSYRWFKDGKPLDEGGVQVPITKTVVAGGTTSVRLGIATLSASGNALVQGDYDLRVDLYLKNVGWFSEHGSRAALQIPVKIGAPADYKATFISSTQPVLMKSGEGYQSVVTLRNDGSLPWNSADGIELTSLWIKSDANTNNIDKTPICYPLPDEVLPGRIAEIPVLLKVSDSSGKALPVWESKDSGYYQVQWSLAKNKKPIGESSGVLRETAEVLPQDDGVQFLGSNMPGILSVDATPKVNVGIRNSGPTTWKKEDYSLGYHWYYQDGIECLWNGEKTTLPYDVAPGDSVVLHDVPVRVPLVAGPMFLVFDLVNGDRWCSTASAVRGADELKTNVYIMNQNYPSFDLSSLYNTSAFTTENDFTAGDFDGEGNTYPTESMPLEFNSKDFTPDTYPCGYLSSAEGVGIMSSRRIVFRWPDTAKSGMDAVACKGQTVGLVPDKFVAFHIMGAATKPDAKGDFVIHYSNNSTMVLPVTMTMWTEKPQHGEHIAANAFHRHTKKGNEPGVPCYLFHYTLNVDSSLPILGITFPNNPDMKVLSMTGQTILTVPEMKLNPLVEKLQHDLKKGQ